MQSEAGSAFSQVAAANSAASSSMVMSAFSATFCKSKRPMRFELGVAASAVGLARHQAPPHTKGLHQVDDKGNRHAGECAAAAVWRE